MCASAQTGCLENTKGMPVTSSKSVTLLGLTVETAGLLPPPRPPGVVGVGPAIARGAGAGAPAPLVDIVADSTLLKK